MTRFRFLCIAGTGGRYHDWCHNLQSPFMSAMREEGGEPLRLPDGSLYSWSGKLQGVLWLGQEEWEREATHVGALLASVPFWDRIVFAHSHGGQIAILLAARGFVLRTLTTLATPYRPNLNPRAAVSHIGFWQHVYDPERDWIATTRRRLGLGNIGGGGGRERRFLVPGVLNVGIPGIRHSRFFGPELQQLRDQAVLRRAHQLGL